MAKEIIYLTAEGYKKLKDDLDHMRSVERPAISAAIAEARDKGDLSENAEYDAAREAQGLLEMRIAKLEETIANARVIDESKIDKSKVQILSRVTLLNHTNGKQMCYTIVSENEANLREGKLAIGTPIAKALLGRRRAIGWTWRFPPVRSTSRFWIFRSDAAVFPPSAGPSFGAAPSFLRHGEAAACGRPQSVLRRVRRTGDAGSALSAAKGPVAPIPRTPGLRRSARDCPTAGVLRTARRRGGWTGTRVGVVVIVRFE